MNWKEIIQAESQKTYFQILKEKLQVERTICEIYPPQHLVFNAFSRTAYDDVTVCILGQDPYFDGNATGVAFECGVRESPSLEKINQRIAQENKITGFYKPCSLVDWTKQGVFLLNVVLTVRAKIFGDELSGAKSHYNIGWQDFTHEIIRQLVIRPKPIVFLLWGSYAKEQFMTAILGIIMDWSRIAVFESNHPAYAAYKKSSWDNNDCFNKANKFLESHNLSPIKWQISNG